MAETRPLTLPLTVRAVRAEPIAETDTTPAPSPAIEPAPSIWAIEPGYFAWMQRRLGAINGQIDLREAPARAVPAQQGAVAVLPVRGPISKRQTFWSMLFGGASTEGIAAAFREAMANETVGAIVLDIDSPGGTVYGVPELADEIYRARGSKPIVAVANDLMASAAYHLASQADTVYVTPSSLTGSIGVFLGHVDLSRALDAEGVTVTLISAGTYKVEGNPFEPLGEEARAAFQREVDYYYGLFTEAVARGRSREGARVTAADVRDGYGEGRVLTARDAIKAGLADKVATLDDVIAGFTRGRRGGTRSDASGQARAEAGAEDEPPASETSTSITAAPARRGWDAVARRLSR